jgi:hypothetical protein
MGVVRDRRVAITGRPSRLPVRDRSALQIGISPNGFLARPLTDITRRT